jgi:hypothetical protein
MNESSPHWGGLLLLEEDCSRGKVYLGRILPTKKEGHEFHQAFPNQCVTRRATWPYFPVFRERPKKAVYSNPPVRRG